MSAQPGGYGGGGGVTPAAACGNPVTLPRAPASGQGRRTGDSMTRCARSVYPDSCGGTWSTGGSGSGCCHCCPALGDILEAQELSCRRREGAFEEALSTCQAAQATSSGSVVLDLPLWALCAGVLLALGAGFAVGRCSALRSRRDSASDAAEEADDDSSDDDVAAARAHSRALQG